MNCRWRSGWTAAGIVAVTLFCLAGPALAQGISTNTFLNWNFLGGGARARGMGGAYLGVSDGGNAGSWNPAGLVYNEGVLLTLDYTFQRTNLTLDNGPAGLPRIPLDVDNTLSNMPSASFVAPITIMEREFKLSVWYNRVQQGFTKSEFRALGAAPGTDTALGSPFTALIGLNGNIGVVGGSFGTAISDRLSIGGTIGIVTGDGTESYSLDLDSLRFPDPKEEHNETVNWTTKSDLDYNGLMFSFGTLYHADRWSAGAVFSPGWTLTQNVRYRSWRRTVNNRTPRVHPFPDGIFSPLAGTDREIDIPSTLGLGGSYKITDKLLIAFDYQYRGFNSNSSSAARDTTFLFDEVTQLTDTIVQTTYESGFRTQEDASNPVSPLESMPVNWYDLHQVRVGAEYEHETNWGTIPFRVGVRNEPLLIGDNSVAEVTFDQRLAHAETAEFPYFIPYTNSTANGSQINAWTFTFGSGIHWSQIALDLSVEFTSFNYAERGALSMIRRCETCDASIDETVSTPGDQPGEDPWGKRKTYAWGDYQRIYDQSAFKLHLNFTGHF